MQEVSYKKCKKSADIQAETAAGGIAERATNCCGPQVQSEMVSDGETDFACSTYIQNGF